MRLQDDAGRLGYAGLLPFAACALLVWLSPSLVPVRFAYAWLEWTFTYAALILSFMAGTRWGLVLAAGGRDAPFSGLLLTTIPSLMAWVAAVPDRLIGVQLGYTPRVAVLAAGFALVLADDLRGVRAGEAPAWYASLRKRLTFWVLLSLGFVLMRIWVA